MPSQTNQKWQELLSKAERPSFFAIEFPPDYTALKFTILELNINEVHSMKCVINGDMLPDAFTLMPLSGVFKDSTDAVMFAGNFGSTVYFSEEDNGEFFVPQQATKKQILDLEKL